MRKQGNILFLSIPEIKKKHSGGFGTHGDRQDLCRGVTRTAAQKTHSTETVVNTKKPN